MFSVCTKSIPLLPTFEFQVATAGRLWSICHSAKGLIVLNQNNYISCIYFGGCRPSLSCYSIFSHNFVGSSYPTTFWFRTRLHCIPLYMVHDFCVYLLICMARPRCCQHKWPGTLTFFLASMLTIIEVNRRFWFGSVGAHWCS